MNIEIVVLCDTREQRNQHLLSALSQKGIKFKCKALKFGDYSFEIGEESFENRCVIERKMSLTEIAGNFCKGRIRFETEFAKANAEGCKVTLLIEDEKARAKMLLRKELDKTLTEKENLIKTLKKQQCEEENEFLKLLNSEHIDEKQQKLNIDYEFTFRKTWKSRFSGNSMISSIKAFKDRYNLDLVFCNKKKTADIMLEIFYKAIEEYFAEVS